MLKITKKYLTNSNNRPKYKIKKHKKIVVHWTANLGKGANAMANRNYFQNTTRAASAHYTVDDSNIVCCVPPNEVAWAVGATRYTSFGNNLREGGYSPNYFTVSIEMCVNSDGNYRDTYKNTVELVAYLLKKYKLKVSDVCRHYDITGKDCPHYLIPEDKWSEFKEDVKRIYYGSSTAYPEYVLKYAPKKKDTNVKVLKQRLKELGYKGFINNSKFGRGTEKAIKAFQKTKGLTIDGKVGINTWKALFNN